MSDREPSKWSRLSPWLLGLAAWLLALPVTFGLLSSFGHSLNRFPLEIRSILLSGVAVVVLLGSIVVAFVITRSKPADHPSKQDDAIRFEGCDAEGMRIVFAETNQHLRNAEQKQLTITGAYLAMLTVVVARIPVEKLEKVDLFGQRRIAAVLAFLAIVGCCVFLLQAWCRVWKEHYLKVARLIAGDWRIPRQALPYWLRHDLREQPDHRLFKANVDNTLMYLTFATNAALVTLLCRQLLFVLDRVAADIAISVVFVIYGVFLWRVERLVKNRRDILAA